VYNASAALTLVVVLIAAVLAQRTRFASVVVVAPHSVAAVVTDFGFLLQAGRADEILVKLVYGVVGELTFAARALNLFCHLTSPFLKMLMTAPIARNMNFSMVFSSDNKSF
jgi:hypothetical protein